MNPKVTIVVPVYNVAEYLPKCLDSLTNQSFGEIEIICFNDASTDQSLDILKKYANQDSRIKIIDSPINIRQGGGRNRGIKDAKGEYIMFVDSDDWVSSNFVEVLYNTAEISHLGNCHNESSNDIKKRILKNGCRLVTSIFKKNIFFENDLFFPENITYEDNAIGTALFLSAKKITKIDEYIYYYRIDNNSTTRSKNNMSYFDRLQTSKLFLKNTSRIDCNNEFRDYINETFVKLFYINTILGSIGQFNPYPLDYIKKAKKELYDLIDKKYVKKFIRKLCFREKLVVYTSLYAPNALPIIIIVEKTIRKLERLNYYLLGRHQSALRKS